MQSSPYDLRKILDRGISGVVQLDKDWRYTYLNRNTAQMLSYLDPNDLIGRSIWQTFPEGINTPFYSACIRAKQEKTFLVIEEYIQSVERWFEFYIYPINEDVTIVFSDITERRQKGFSWKSLDQKSNKIDRELSALYNASKHLQKLFTPEQLSQEIIAVLESLLDYTYSAVLLIDEADGVSLRPFALSLQHHGKEFLDADKEYINSKGPRVGVGVTGWVAEHGESARIGDVLSDPRYFAMRQDIHSELCVPLFLMDRVIGVINIESTRENAYSENDQRLLETIAAQIAVSIQNAHNVADIRGRTKELETVLKINQSLNNLLDSSVIIRTSLEKLKDLYRANFTGFVRFYPDSQDATLVQSIGDIPPSITASDIPIFSPLFNMIKAGNGVLVKKAEEDSLTMLFANLHPELAKATLMLAPILAEVNKPASSPGTLTGFFAVLKTEPPAFNNSDLFILQSVASVVAVAIQNANLYENLGTIYAERERTQHLLIQSEKMSTFGKLAASLAHEINNPLQSIKGSLTLFQEEMEENGDPKKLIQYKDIITSEIERIVRLVRRMRDFYQPLPQQIQPVDIHEVLENVLSLTAKELSSAHIDVKTDLVKGLKRIKGNPDHFRQLFINLILNAKDAMQEGGILHITTELINLRKEKKPKESSRSPEISIRFSDTGCGVSPEALGQIFEQFYTTKGNGSGLGLYVCADIVKSYNGKINVTSNLHEETTFTILLPYHPEVSKR